MKTTIYVISFLSFAVSAYAQNLSDREKSILNLVASERGLTQEQTALLYAIRAHENGAPGLECGVEQPCARYYRDGFVSLIVQADCCAWIIKQRFRGKIYEFGKTYNNGNVASVLHWGNCVKRYYLNYLCKIKKKTVKSNEVH